MKKYAYRDTVTGRIIKSDVPIKDPALVLVSERRNMKMQGSKIRTS